MKPNPFLVPIKKKPLRPLIHGDLLCPVCGRSLKVVAQWRRCFSCDDTLTGWNDAEPEIMRAWSRPDIWPAPVAGTA